MRDDGLKYGFFTKNTYQNPASLNIYDGIFRCSYPLRFDTYKTCYVGCNYCFANLGRLCLLESKELKNDFGLKEITKLNNLLQNVLYEGNLSGGEEIVKTMLSRRIPILFGTVTEIFPLSEKVKKITLEALNVFKFYNYPLVLSTKGGILCDDGYKKDYYKIFDKYDRDDKDKILFRVTLIGIDNEKVKQVEPNAPSVEQRLKLLKEVNELGVETIVRMQPFIFGISDCELEKYFEKIKETGTDTVVFEGLKINCNLLKYTEKNFAEKVKKDCVFLNGFYVYDVERLEEIIKKIEQLAKKYDIELGFSDTYFMHKNVGNVNCCGNKTKKIKSEWTLNGFSWYLDAVKKAEILKDYYVLKFNDIVKYIPEWIDKKFSLNAYHTLFYKKGTLLSKGKKIKKDLFYSFRDFLQKNWNDIGQYHSFGSDLKICIPVKNGKPMRDKYGNYIYLVSPESKFKDYSMVKVEYESLSERVKSHF